MELSRMVIRKVTGKSMIPETRGLEVTKTDKFLTKPMMNKKNRHELPLPEMQVVTSTDSTGFERLIKECYDLYMSINLKMQAN